jgi:hypothetical protein
MGVVGGEERDEVVFLAPGTPSDPYWPWYRLDIESRTVVREDRYEPPVFVTSDQPHIFQVGACGSENERKDILVVSEHGVAEVYTRNDYGDLVAHPDNPFRQVAGLKRIVASGCVSDESGGLHRTVVFVDFMDRWQVVFQADGVKQLELSNPMGTVGFVRDPGSGLALMLTGLLGAESPGVARWRLDLSVGDNPRLELASWDLLLGLPELVAGGDVDGDGLGDVVTLWANPFDVESLPGRPQFAAQFVLGVAHRGQRVSAGMLVTEQDDMEFPEEWVLHSIELTDLDGNGADDFLMFYQRGVFQPWATDTFAVAQTYLMGG